MARLAVVLQTATTVLALGGALLLVAASVGHLAHFDRLRAVVIVQKLVPYRAHRALAAGLVLVELGVGVAVLVAVIAIPAAARPALVVETAVYVLLLGYLVLLRFVRPGTPCGCFSGDGPVGWSAMARAGLFALGAGAAVVVASPTSGGLSLVSYVAAAVVVATLARVAPTLPRRIARPGLTDQPEPTSRPKPTSPTEPTSAPPSTSRPAPTAQPQQAATSRR